MTIKDITLLHNKCRFLLNFSYRFICASNNSYMPRIRTCETSKPKHLKKLYEFGCHLLTDLHLKINALSKLVVRCFIVEQTFIVEQCNRISKNVFADLKIILSKIIIRESFGTTFIVLFFSIEFLIVRCVSFIDIAVYFFKAVSGLPSEQKHEQL